MEALKIGNPKEFVFGDLTVFVKPHASSQDRMEVAFEKNMSGRFKLAARVMVTGWKGFARDGKSVDYSVDELANVPDMPARSFAIELGMFIWKNTDISGMGGEALKKA